MASGRVRLYRVNLTGDLLSNRPANELITFNVSNPKDTKVENPFCTQVEILPSEAIAENQAVGQDFSNIQPLGRFEKLYTLTCFFSNVFGDASDGLNEFVDITEKWEREDKKSDIFDEGRHGIDLDDMVRYNVIPTEVSSGDVTGLLFIDVKWILNWKHSPARVEATIRLKQTRGDGT